MSMFAFRIRQKIPSFGLVAEPRLTADMLTFETDTGLPDFKLAFLFGNSVDTGLPAPPVLALDHLFFHYKSPAVFIGLPLISSIPMAV
jgi:hypothetical protein